MFKAVPFEYCAARQSYREQYFNDKDTYVSIVSCYQKDLYARFKADPCVKILFESEEGINTNYPVYDYNKPISKSKWGYVQYAREYKPRNMFVVYEYVPNKESSIKVWGLS